MNNNETEYKCITFEEETTDDFQDIQEHEDVSLNDENENNTNICDELENNDINENEETEATNCLALTVRKDYNLSIFRNRIIKTFHVTSKVALCTFLLNLLTLLL